MSDLVDMNTHFLNGFRELLQRKEDENENENEDWGAKLEHFCETFWIHLDENASPPQEVINAFIDVLLKEESFAVVRLVIPEFRGELSVKFENEIKQRVMDHTAHLRAEQTNAEKTTPLSFNDPLYRAEKEIFHEAEMYRAGLLLYYQGNLSETERGEIQKWWAARPGCMRQVDGTVGTEMDDIRTSEVDGAVGTEMDDIRISEDEDEKDIISAGASRKRRKRAP